jgi:hypothetical protein
MGLSNIRKKPETRFPTMFWLAKPSTYLQPLLQAGVLMGQALLKEVLK